MTTENPTTSTSSQAPSKRTHVVLWIVQAVLALLFVFAGGSKLVMPLAELTKQAPLPGGFLRFIGVCELLGGLGLVLPGIFGIKRGLTPLAASGLTIIMIGAVVTTLAVGMGAAAVIPLIVGVLTAAVAIGRRGWARAGATAASGAGRGSAAGALQAGAARH
jgi:hypothetical protein